MLITRGPEGMTLSTPERNHPHPGADPRRGRRDRRRRHGRGGAGGLPGLGLGPGRCLPAGQRRRRNRRQPPRDLRGPRRRAGHGLEGPLAQDPQPRVGPIAAWPTPAAAAARSSSPTAASTSCTPATWPPSKGCKRLGDLLVVGLNSDASVRGLKGDSRPVIDQENRASLLAGLACVDVVVIFDEPTPEELIRQLDPDVLVKGGDYTRGPDRRRRLRLEPRRPGRHLPPGARAEHDRDPRAQGSAMNATPCSGNPRRPDIPINLR